MVGVLSFYSKWRHVSMEVCILSQTFVIVQRVLWCHFCNVKKCLRGWYPTLWTTNFLLKNNFRNNRFRLKIEKNDSFNLYVMHFCEFIVVYKKMSHFQRLSVKKFYGTLIAAKLPNSYSLHEVELLHGRAWLQYRRPDSASLQTVAGRTHVKKRERTSSESLQ